MAKKSHGKAHNKAEGRGQASIYKIWSNMLQRCGNPNNTRYADYGGRGITVCERWKTFENFFADVGDRPSNLTLDRIDNDRGYQPDNVRWVTRADNNRNSRRCVMVEVNGESKPINVWAKQHGIPYVTVKQRRRNGWDLVRAVTTPPNPLRQRKDKRTT